MRLSVDDDFHGDFQIFRRGATIEGILGTGRRQGQAADRIAKPETRIALQRVRLPVISIVYRLESPVAHGSARMTAATQRTHDVGSSHICSRMAAARNCVTSIRTNDPKNGVPTLWRSGDQGIA